MPHAAVGGPVAVASLLAGPREGVRRHTFAGANFLMEDVLGAHRDELAVTAQPAELAAATTRIYGFSASQSARITSRPCGACGEPTFISQCVLRTLLDTTAHGLPFAPAWLHVVVTAADGHIVFESGKLNPGRLHCRQPERRRSTRYSPHFTTHHQSR